MDSPASAKQRGLGFPSISVSTGGSLLALDFSQSGQGLIADFGFRPWLQMNAIPSMAGIHEAYMRPTDSCLGDADEQAPSPPTLPKSAEQGRNSELLETPFREGGGCGPGVAKVEDVFQSQALAWLLPLEVALGRRSNNSKA